MTPRKHIYASFLLALCVTAASGQVTSKEVHIDAQLQAMADDVAAENAAAKPHPEYAIGSQTPNLIMDGFIADHYTANYGDTKHYFFVAVATEQTKTQNGSVPNASGSTHQSPRSYSVSRSRTAPS